MDLEDIMAEFDQVNLGGAQCDTCGFDQFYNEMGHYFCKICNTQSQEVREVVTEENFEVGRLNGPRAGVLKGPRTKESSADVSDRKVILSRWEVFNHILKIMVDRLVDLGYPEAVKDKAFRLWTAYLIKRKAIFIDPQEEDQRYPISQQFDNCSIRRFYDWEPPKKKRRKKNQDKEDENDKNKLKIEGSQEDENNLQFQSLSSVRRQRTVAKRKAMEADYSSQMLNNDDGEIPGPSTAIRNKIESITSAEANKAKKIKFKYSNARKKIIKALNLKETEKRNKLKKTLFRDALLPETFTLKTLYALIFVALRQIGCSVVFTDLFRMACDGTLSTQSIKLLLDPEDAASVKSYCDLFMIKSFNAQFLEYADIIKCFILYLGIKEFNYPRVNEILPKFIDNFVLPREMECHISEMDRLLPWETLVTTNGMLKMRDMELLMEFHTLNLIVIQLTMLFGLDDVTERYQSKFARAVNEIIESFKKAKKKKRARKKGANSSSSSGESENEEEVGDWIKLFVIEDWLKYIRYQRELIKTELFTREIYSPTRNPGVTKIHNLIESLGGQKGDHTSKMYAPELVNKLKEVRDLFKNFANDKRIYPSPQYLTTTLPQQDVTLQYLKNHPKVNNPTFKKKLLQCDFTKERIDFVFDPQKYIPILKEAGYTVKVIKGDGKQYVPKQEDENKSNVLILFQPYRNYDDNFSLPQFYSKSLQLVVECCLDSIMTPKGGRKKCKTLFCTLLKGLGHNICSRIIKGVFPIEPYSNADLDVEKLEEDERKRKKKIMSDFAKSVPYIDLRSDSEESD